MASGGSDWNAKYALSKLLQMGTVAEYESEFVILANRVTGISANLLKSFYISGLKLELQRELFRSMPTPLGKAFSLARIAEARFEDERSTITIAKPNKLTARVHVQDLEQTTQGRGDEPNRILLVTIHYMIYPITVEVLHQVFSPLGYVEKVIIFQKSAGFQALIQFQSRKNAIAARNLLQSCNIYEGCCQLDIPFSNLEELQENQEEHICYYYWEDCLSFLNAEEADNTKPPLYADTFGNNGGDESETSGPETPALIFFVGYGTGKKFKNWKELDNESKDKKVERDAEREGEPDILAPFGSDREGKNKISFIDGSCRRSNTDEVLGKQWDRFLMGLDDSYMHIRSSILSRETLPDVRSVDATIYSEENTFQRNQTSNNGPRPNNVNNNRQGGGSSLVCEHCGFNGHTIDRCFKLIGYLVDFGKKKSRQNFKNKNVSNNNTVGSSSSSGFTDEQLSTLISLIKDNSLNRKNVQANMTGFESEKCSRDCMTGIIPNDDERVYPSLNNDQRSQSDRGHSSMPGGDMNTADFPNDNSRNDAQSNSWYFRSRNDTWEIVNLPKDRKAIGSKWIFKIKYKSSGEIDRYKARLVAQGFNKKEGVDYEETFFIVVKMVTVRCLLNLVVSSCWPVFQVDVNNAFLYGDLVETVYMKLPEGCYPTGNNKVCRLKKSLYDLKQAHRQWNAKLTYALIENGFSQSKYNYSLYTKYDKGVFVALLVYVDDIIIIGNSVSEINKFKVFLKSKFMIKYLGKIKYFLGIEIIDIDKVICLNQRKYVFDLLFEYGMLACKHAKTYLMTKLAISNKAFKEDPLLDNITDYQKVNE
ncbi:ribonuclease H-like domain-containing protein [Tanacetum coccineum]